MVKKRFAKGARADCQSASTAITSKRANENLRLSRVRFCATLNAMTSNVFPDESNVLEACGRLVDFGAWDQTKIDPEGWLGNFSAAERPFALVLLSRFTFLSDHLVDQLFRSAFQNLSTIGPRVTKAPMIIGAPFAGVETFRRPFASDRPRFARLKAADHHRPR